MIIINAELLSKIENAATIAYPAESCGLLMGHGTIKDRLVITRVEISPNRTENDKQDSFEIDPQLRFDLMRELEGGSEQIVGHFHSHPNGPAQPSTRDADQAWEPELVWVITSIANGQLEETAAYRFDENSKQFHALEIQAAE